MVHNALSGLRSYAGGNVENRFIGNLQNDNSTWLNMDKTQSMILMNEIPGMVEYMGKTSERDAPTHKTTINVPPRQKVS